MPEMIPVEVPIRGHVLRLTVPGPDAEPTLALASHIEMLALSLLALEDPRVDAVLAAFGFAVTYTAPDSGEVVTIAPEAGEIPGQ